MLQEKKITVEAASLEDALKEVSAQWQVPVEELSGEILGEERKGFLGLGGKTLKVEVKTTLKPDLFSRATDFVNSVLKYMDFKAEAVPLEDQKNTLDIQGADAADYVVGKYGDALKGMEYLVNLALRDPKAEPRIRIDSCGYRARRTKSLERLAEATARQAIKYGRPVRLEPMASWERWVIHVTLKNRDDVSTESVGEPPVRQVIIMPKFDPEQEGTPGPATMRIRARREYNSPSAPRTPGNNNRRNSRRRNPKRK